MYHQTFFHAGVVVRELHITKKSLMKFVKEVRVITKSELIDESLIGWKEFELEVVRDKKDNCIIVCAIENFDAMGVHTEILSQLRFSNPHR